MTGQAAPLPVFLLIVDVECIYFVLMKKRQLLFFFETEFLSVGCPGTHSVAQASLEPPWSVEIKVMCHHGQLGTLQYRAQLSLKPELVYQTLADKQHPCKCKVPKFVFSTPPSSGMGRTPNRG